MFAFFHLFLLHMLLVLRSLILLAMWLVVSTGKAFSLLTARLLKAALDLIRFRAAQRIFVYLPETQELHRGIIIICYDDGCSVDVEVCKFPRMHRTCFFTHEQLSACNPKQQREQPPGTAALSLALAVTGCYGFSTFIMLPPC